MRALPAPLESATQTAAFLSALMGMTETRGQLCSPCGHSTRRNWQPVNSRSRDRASCPSTSAQARITSRKQSCSRRQTRAHAEAPVVYTSYPGEHVVLSGGSRIEPHWTPYRDGILQTPVPPGTQTDQLFVNGKRQVLARYPNYEPNAKYLNGWAEDAISPERAKRWADPRGGYIHALHEYLWGSLHYEITGTDADGHLTYEGGWQTNRPAPMHKQYRYVENIFEELDAPGEWFLDTKKNILYYYPPKGLDLKNAVVEVVRLKHLVEMRGTAQSPVKWIDLRNFTFRHTLRTFMETREPLLRSDWRIYRGGALFFTGTEDCHVEECMFDQLGGNCIFVSNYNRRFHAVRCHLAEACANGIAFVGDSDAVRSPLFSYDDRHTRR